MSCAPRRECAGVTDCNLLAKRIPAISFLSRPTYRIRKSMPVPNRFWNVLVRSDGEAIAINLHIEPVEKPETVLWVDQSTAIPAKVNNFQPTPCSNRLGEMTAFTVQVGAPRSKCRVPYAGRAGRLQTLGRCWCSCTRDLKAGEVIFREGDPAHELFIIHSKRRDRNPSRQSSPGNAPPNTAFSAKWP